MRTFAQFKILLCLSAFTLFLFANPVFAEKTDYDNDGTEDITAFDPGIRRLFVRFSWNPSLVQEIFLGSIGDVPVVGDFDGDGVTDAATFNRTTGAWSLSMSTDGALSVAYGSAGDIPVPGRYDGDSCTQLATFSPSTGTWSLLNCRTAVPTSVSLGQAGDIPIPADYDGDGSTDPAVVNPKTFVWTINNSGGSTSTVQLGLPGDIPIALDFNGTGTDLPAVFRSTTNMIYVKDGDNTWQFPLFQGQLGDRLLTLELEGTTVDPDGRADFTTFHPTTSTYDVTTSNLHNFLGVSIPGVVPTTYTPASIPLPVSSKQFMKGAVPGDVDRNLKADFVFTAKVGAELAWAIQTLEGGIYYFTFGLANDRGLLGDTNGDLREEAVVTRDGPAGIKQWFMRPIDGTPPSLPTHEFGLNDDTPLLGDFDCDGKDDLAVVREGTSDLVWYLRPSSARTLAINESADDMDNDQSFGLPGDIVGAADLDGDGCDEMVAVRAFAGQWYFFAKNAVSGAEMAIAYGLDSDNLLHPMDFNGDGTDQVAVIRENADRTRTVYIKKPDGTDSVIPIGAGNGEVMGGNFLGLTTSEIAVYNKAVTGVQGSATIYRFDGGVDSITTSTVALPWIASDAKLVKPSSRSFAGNSLGVDCDIITSFSDGRGGKLWKPVSDNTRQPVILMPSSYWTTTSSIQVFGSDGTFLLNGVRRNCCHHNGGRAHYDVFQHGSVLAQFKPIIVRFNRTSGMECYVVPEPQHRYD